MNEIAVKEIIKTSLVSEKLAAVLSEKSIGIEYSDKANTASIDFGRKVITFPMKANMSNVDVHMLFLCHEVGHLIFSSLELCMRSHDAKVDSYCHNVVLDIRDERLFKEAYPGFVKYFRKGYEFLLKDGFFGVPADIMFHGFTSRLNAYAKLGFPLNSFIPMSSVELEFYDRCMKAETEDDVNTLAIELFAINKASQDEIRELLKNATPDDIENLMESLMKKPDVDTSPEEVGEDELQSYDAIFGDSDPKTYSDEELDELAQKLREESTLDTKEYDRRQLMNGIFTAIYQSPEKIGYYTIKDFLNLSTSSNSPDYIHQWGKKYVDQFASSVKHMAMVFESKKAAKRNQNRKISKTGLLNISRIAHYRTSDDIFLSRLEVNNVKNHGVVLLMDCSGSIAKMFYDLTKQMVTLTEFCRKVGIPFKVIGFGMTVKSVNQFLDGAIKQSTNVGYYWDKKCVKSDLMEICSSEQSTSEYFQSLYHFRARLGWEFGGTPTTSALTLVEKIAPRFFNGIDQRKVVILTDGEATDGVGGISRSYVYDPVVKQGFFNNIAYHGFHSCLPMINILKMRHNIDTSIICVGNNRGRNTITSMAYRIIPGFAAEISKFNSDFKAKDFYCSKSLYNTSVFFMRPVDIHDDNSKIDFAEAETANQYKSRFVKHYKDLNKSKILLNSVVESLSF